MSSPGGPSPLAKTSPSGRGSGANALLEGAAPAKKLLSLQELLPLKSIKTSKAAAKDQGVDFVRALIGVDRLQVRHVADDREFERNAAGAVDGTRHTGDFERLGHTIFLGHAHLVGGQAVPVC